MQDEALPKEEEFLIGVFWGAFDPPTKAHIAIVEKALTLPFIHHLFIVINNTSYKEYSLPPENRKEELLRALAYLHSEKITILEQDDQHPLNFAALEKITSRPLCAIAGYDAYVRWVGYSSAQERSHYKAIAVVPRGDGKPELMDANAFLLPIDPSLKHTSSSQSKRDSRFAK